MRRTIKLLSTLALAVAATGALAASPIQCDTNQQMAQYTLEHSTWDQPPVVPRPIAVNVVSRTTTATTCAYKIDYTIPYMDQKDHFHDVTLAINFPGTAGKWLCHLSTINPGSEVYRCDIQYWYSV